MTTSYLDRPTGRLAYELTGDPNGPLVVLSPGMGDLRSTFDGLAERLAADGAQVVNADLRGHGESSTGWDAYGVSAVADDLLALLHAHGGRGVLVGNSYSGSAAVIAAAREPEAVSGLVLAGAFVRDGEQSVLQKALFALFHRAFPGRPLWTAMAWPSFFKRRPAELRGPQGGAGGEPQAAARLRRAGPDDHRRGHPPAHHADCCRACTRRPW